MKIKNLLETREKIIDLTREFFKKGGFTEVETPLLIPAPDPAPYNEVFETSPVGHQRAFLTPSPEFFMKKMISSGAGNIFQICKAFRNPIELDPLHNPEFTILEWYRVDVDYFEIMKDCEKLVTYIGKFYKFSKNIATPWPRLTMKGAFLKYAKVDLDEFSDFRKASQIAQKKGYQADRQASWEQLFHQIFLNEIEPKFPKHSPLILYEYPAALAALAKLKDQDPRYAERFEFYLGGLEVGNGYSELTDWKEQERRLKTDLEERKQKKMKVFDYDKDFVRALKKGLPKVAGIAVGIDRLMMFFSKAQNIQEVLSFPATEIFRP